MQNFLHIRRTAIIWPIMRMSPLYPYVGNSFFRPVKLLERAGNVWNTSAIKIGTTVAYVVLSSLQLTLLPQRVKGFIEIHHVELAMLGELTDFIIPQPTTFTLNHSQESLHSITFKRLANFRTSIFYALA